MKERDCYQLLVPAKWEIPGAGPFDDTSNEDLSQGTLRAEPASVLELVGAGTELPGPVFRAHGPADSGGRSGVMIGVYDLGLGDSLEALAEALSKTVPPDATVEPVVSASADALRVNWPVREIDAGTPSVVFDLWVPIPKPGHQFVVLRFWRDGGGSGESVDHQLEYMASSFDMIAPGTYSEGPLRRLVPMVYAPPEADEDKDGWRLAGNRLGSIFHTKVVPTSRLGAYVQGVSRKRDRAVLLVEFVVWLALIIGLAGWNTPLLLAGAGCYLGATAAAKSGWKAWVGLGVALVALLAVGLAAG